MVSRSKKSSFAFLGGGLEHIWGTGGTIGASIIGWFSPLGANGDCGVPGDKSSEVLAGLPKPDSLKLTIFLKIVIKKN